MAKVVITAQVENGAKWEASFLTHTDLFRTYGVSSPVEFGVQGNSVTVCTEARDAAAFVKTLGEPATVDAMKADGVKRETVKIMILDKKMKF